MWKLVTAPAEEPLTTAEAKTHLKVSGTDEDTLIGNLIVAARQHAERYLRRALVSQTWDYYVDDFTDPILLQKSPVTEVSSIKYYDTDNVLQTLSDSYYEVDLVSEPCRINEAYGYTYPDVYYDKPNAVQIRVVCGYTDSDAVPDLIKQGMYLFLTHLYEHRGDESIRPPRAIYDLWDNYRVFRL